MNYICFLLSIVNSYFLWALKDLKKKLLSYAFSEIINLVGTGSFYYLSEVINLSNIYLSRFYYNYRTFLGLLFNKSLFPVKQARPK